MNHHNNCPICCSSETSSVINRKNVPVHQNLIYSDKISSIKAKKGDLSLLVCNVCGFIFNSTFDISKLNYGNNYDNTQELSPSFALYMNELSKNLLINENVKNCTIIEIGCGKGSFLKKLIDNEYGNIGIGYDPSYVGNSEILNGRIKFFKEFYDEYSPQFQADVIVCRHVIEHIPEPIKMLKQIRKLLKPSTKIFFETPSVNWILENKIIYDFFYEHCSYFSPSSLKTAFEISGFEVRNIDLVFEGQYMWLKAIPSNNIKISKNPNTTIQLAKEFSLAENFLITQFSEKIKKLCIKGKIAVWGAGAKGVTFVNLFDKEHKYIDSVIDLNPNKCGKFLPGTGHQIIPYTKIKQHKIENIILMNSNYYEENLKLLNNEKINVNLIK